MTDKSVIVTGAAGSIGKLAVDHLARRGFAVHAVDKRPQSRVPPGVVAHVADIKKRGFDDGKCVAQVVATLQVLFCRS